MKSPVIAVIVAGMVVVSGCNTSTGFTKENMSMAADVSKSMEYCIQDACFTRDDNGVAKGAALEGYADNQIRRGPCRNYSSEAIIDGKRQTVHGTACRQTDGSWKSVRVQ